MWQVFLTTLLSSAVALLCGATSVLLGTHILRPMMHFSQCTVSSHEQCQCWSPFSRNHLALNYSPQSKAGDDDEDSDGDDGDDVYDDIFVILMLVMMIMTAVMTMI